MGKQIQRTADVRGALGAGIPRAAVPASLALVVALVLAGCFGMAAGSGTEPSSDQGSRLVFQETAPSCSSGQQAAVVAALDNGSRSLGWRCLAACPAGQAYFYNRSDAPSCVPACKAGYGQLNVVPTRSEFLDPLHHAGEVHLLKGRCSEHLEPDDQHCEPETDEARTQAEKRKERNQAYWACVSQVHKDAYKGGDGDGLSPVKRCARTMSIEWCRQQCEQGVINAVNGRCE